MHAFFTSISRIMALLGGAVLGGIVLLLCLSITGRSLNTALNSNAVQELAPALANLALSTGLGSITGDYEILEAAMAFVIFAFLPLCQIGNGHAAVDLFTRRLPRVADRGLRVLTDAAFAVVLIVIALQLHDGMESKIRSAQTTFLLQFPVWWGYAASLFAATVAAVVGVHVAVTRIVELLGGGTIIAESTEPTP